MVGVIVLVAWLVSLAGVLWLVRGALNDKAAR
jgi:hypothetical protein